MLLNEVSGTFGAYSLLIWLSVLATLVGAGVIKGTIGFGLPTVAVSVLSNLIDVHLALAVMTLPIVTSNLWLGLQGGRFLATLRTFWVVVAAVGAGIFLGAWFMAEVDPQLLMLILGLTVILFSLMEQFKRGDGFFIPEGQRRAYGVGIGGAAGIMGGLTTAYGPLLILYITALRLPKEVHVATIGVIWFFASVFLVIAFSSVQILTPRTGVLSALAVLPVFAGLWLGKRLRGRADQHLFQRITLIALLALGLNLVRRAVF